jgi:hypothetical protein
MSGMNMDRFSPVRMVKPAVSENSSRCGTVNVDTEIDSLRVSTSLVFSTLINGTNGIKTLSKRYPKSIVHLSMVAFMLMESYPIVTCLRYPTLS